MSLDPSVDQAAAKNFLRTPTSWDALDDMLLLHLKDNQKLGWKEIALNFHNRTPNACQFRWRRLKSGNLKNPPKSAAQGLALQAQNSPSNLRRPSHTPDSEPPKKARRVLDLTGTLGGVYSPLANTTFTGYESVNSALAGLNALAANLGSGSASAPSGLPAGPINTTLHPQTFDKLPKLDVPLDPQAHTAANSSGGYFTDISVDPTLNLPQNRPHLVPNAQGLTPRSSNADQNYPLMHNNSIIQIARDDRPLVSLQRHSVLSLPSKSMEIPHHHSNALAHMPVLFGGLLISGPAGSVLGPAGFPLLASALSSIRNGLIVGPSQAYLRRLLMLIVHPERRMSDKEKRPAKSELATPQRATPTPQPIFKIPWSMEEDELLINRRRKELSFAELSILLPQRTEGEIWARIDALEKLRSGHRALVSRAARRRRQLLLGLDDVDDFYDEVDSVIDMDSEDDNDDVLVDVDDRLASRSRKRRASSAVNPLSVREGIRGKLR